MMKPDEATRTRVSNPRITCALAFLVASSAFPESATPGGPASISVSVPDAMSGRMILPDTPSSELGAEKEIVLSAARGEYEPATFVVRNDSDEAQRIRFEAGDLVGSSGAIARSSIELKHVLVWFQATGAWTDWRKPRRNWDAFLTPELLVNDPELIRVDRKQEHNYLRLNRPSGPEYALISTRELNRELSLPTIAEQPVYDSSELQPVTVPAGENHQVWITLKVPRSARPGRYSGSIRIVGASGKELGRLPVTLAVHEIELPPPRIEYSMYYRGKLADHNPTVSSEWKSTPQLIADMEAMISHGISNPTCYQRLWPKDDVERVGPYTTRQLVLRYLGIRRDLGLDGRPLYFIGRATGKSADPRHLARLASDTRELLMFAESYGASGLYLYGADEALGQGLIDQQRAWQTVKSEGAKVFVAGSADHFEKSNGLTDLLVYHGKPNRKVAEQQHGVGNRIFKYSEPQAGPEDPLLWRKSFGIAIWQADYDGAMPYAFQSQDGSIWNDWDGLNYRTASLTYPTADKPISTLAFEGLREGIDDVRYLTALENAISRSEGEGDPADSVGSAVRAAAEFLDQLKSRSSFDPATVRQEIVSLLEMLGNAESATGASRSNSGTGR